jgi:predicted RNA binding protein YcfA (HicA-like mRNA interferase family)
MPSRSQLPDDLKQKKFIKALKRLGFEVSVRGGKGSHCKVTWVQSQKSVTIPSHIRKDVLYYVVKELEAISGVTWEDITAVPLKIP